MFRFLFVLFLFAVSASAGAKDKTILILGDSLSAGYGINIEYGWVALLGERLSSQGYRYNVINSSISGDTTRGALVRLERELENRGAPEIAIIELGGNDGLRGLSLEEIRTNLSRIIVRLANAGSSILLIPIRLPPNYGPVYNEKFMEVYRDLARENQVTLGRFILEDIAGKPQLMQEDGIHPLEPAQMQMLDNIWPQLETLISGTVAGNP